MKRVVLILSTLVLFLSTADAATYYVSPSGSWGGAGTVGDPWNHPNRFNYSPAAAGDTLIFVTTGSTIEYDSCMWTLKNGSASAKTYWMPTNGIADRGEVICHSGRPVADSWTNSSGQIYYTTCNYGTTGTRWMNSPDTGRSNVCAYQRIGGTVDSLLIPMNSTSLAEGQMYYDNATSRLYVWCYGGGSPGTKIRASTYPVIVSNQDYDHNYFIGLDLRGGYQGVVVLGYGSSDLPSPLNGGGGGGDSNFFVHCNIGIAIETHINNPCVIYHGNTYGASKTSWSQYAHVQSCSLTQSRGYRGEGGFHAGFGIELYAADNWVIDSNEFVKTGAGIGLKMGNVEDYGFDADSIKIRFNHIDQTHMTAIGESSNGIWVGNKNKYTQIVGNIIRGCNIGIIFAASTPSGDCIEGGSAILNNTILDCSESMMQLTPCQNYGQNVIKYNIVCDSLHDMSYAGAMSFRDNEYGTQVVDTFWSVVDSNQYYWGGSGAFAGHFQAGSTCSGTSFANWQSCGFDANSTNGTDPQLNATTYLPANATAMNVTHSGRTWTQYGAIQEEVACADTLVAPVFESPANGATGQQNSVILDWSDSTQVGTVTAYDLQVDDNSDFSSLTFSSSPTDSRDTVTTTLSFLTPYYWRVRGRTACDTSAWSDSRSFVMGDSCIQITGKTTLAASDTCYCIVDSLLYTFAQYDTLIHTNSKDNIRIWGYGTGGGRGIIGYSISDTGSNSTVTDAQTGSVGIHVAGSDNVLIKNLAIVPRTIDDSVRSFVCVNAATVVGINLDNDSIVAGGFSSRAYQQSTTSANRSFNQLLQNSYFGTVSKGYHRRDALYGATIKLVTSIIQSDRYGGTYNYSYKIRNNRIHTIHTGIGSSGLTVDTSPTPDDTIYPLIFIDSNTVTVDTRNDLFMTFDDNDVNNSAGDPYGIAVDGVDKGSRIMGNSISSMASTYYGGDGLLLQHIDATVDSPFVVAYNTMALQHGAHPRIVEGRQAVVGTYIRNYSTGYYVSGLHYHHNTGYLVVDSHDSSTYRGKLYECVRMGYDNGARGNIIENNHFSVVASDSATRTTIDSLQGSGLSFVQRDSLYTGREYTGRGTIARNNYWRVPKTPFWFGDTRIGFGANNCIIDGDTANTIYPGDSTFVRFHQSGTYFDHHSGNSIRNVTLQGYADAADVVKGTIGIADSSSIPYPTENRHKQGKQLELARTMNLLVTDEGATPIADATVWAVNAYGGRNDFANTSGAGTTNDLLRWRFFGYDILSDGYTVEDSSAFNDFTIWAKSGSDSASVSWTIGAGRALTDTIAITLTEPTPSVNKVLRGGVLKGAVIK